MEEKILCSSCGTEMELEMGGFTIGLDGGGGLLADVLYAQYNVDLYTCPHCGKVEMYSSNFHRAEQPRDGGQRPPREK